MLTNNGFKRIIDKGIVMDVLGCLEDKGFNTKVHRCGHTGSLPVYKHGLVRRHYVVMAVRRRNDEESSQGGALSDGVEQSAEQIGG